MKIEINEISNIPLQQQIVAKIKSMILSGVLSADYQLPSIRVFAKDNRVSVITVQKAYEILESDGLIYSKLKKGFFVSNLKQTERENISRENLINAISPIIKKSIAEGLDKSEIEVIVRKVINELQVNYEH